MAPRTSRDLAPLIDHTLLRPDATSAEVARLCQEAREYGFAGACVRIEHIALVARLLEGSAARPIAVVDFPLGEGSTSARVAETREAVSAGAREIDVVIDRAALQRGDYGGVHRDLRAVVEAARPALVKVILETASLSYDEKVIGCALAKAAGAAFVKTSTGFGSGGATVEEVALLRRIAGADMDVKASGGIRTAADARRMIQAGANRIGTSAGVAIVTSPDVP